MLLLIAQLLLLSPATQATEAKCHVFCNSVQADADPRLMAQLARPVSVEFKTTCEGRDINKALCVAEVMCTCLPDSADSMARKLPTGKASSFSRLEPKEKATVLKQLSVSDVVDMETRNAYGDDVNKISFGDLTEKQKGDLVDNLNKKLNPDGPMHNPKIAALKLSDIESYYFATPLDEKKHHTIRMQWLPNHIACKKNEDGTCSSPTKCTLPDSSITVKLGTFNEDDLKEMVGSVQATDSGEFYEPKSGTIAK